MSDEEQLVELRRNLSMERAKVFREDALFLLRLLDEARAKAWPADPGVLARAQARIEAMGKAEEMRIREEEREACAKVADHHHPIRSSIGPLHAAGWNDACVQVAAAIRARGNKPNAAD